MASGTAVIVLGTEFHVSSAAGQGLTEVCVYRGAVRVQQGAQGVTLRDSDEVAVQNDILLRKKKISDFDSLLAGTDIDQRFHFDNCSLTEAVQQIADYYHADVSNPTHTRGVPVKGDPAQSLPLTALLKDIELIEEGKAHLGLHGKTILISAAPIK
jgi:ferric-dicitrate binding protein FerR (iron transport regulator)